MSFKRTFTPAEKSEITLQRAEMRFRLTCPDADYEAVCAATRAAQAERKTRLTP